MFADAIYQLGKIQAKVTYISFEPLLEHIPVIGQDFQFHRPDWVIIGAQTRPYKPPKIEWVREIVEAADKAGVPVFIKNNLASYARNISLYPEMEVGDDAWDEIRQELPK